jgi:hypothetical protein
MLYDGRTAEVAHREVPAGEAVKVRALAVGDTIRVEGQTLEVVGEPETRHRGWSLFDEFEILLSVPVRRPGSDRGPIRLVFGPDDSVLRLGSERASDDSEA